LDPPISLKVFKDRLNFVQSVDRSRHSQGQPHGESCQVPRKSLTLIVLCGIGFYPQGRDWPKILSHCGPHFVKDDGMKRSAPFFGWKLFAYRQFSSSSHQSTPSSKSLQDRLPSRETWTRAWKWFLWVPAIIFVNDHVISLSPVNGISMRPTVMKFLPTCL